MRHIATVTLVIPQNSNESSVVCLENGTPVAIYWPSAMTNTQVSVWVGDSPSTLIQAYGVTGAPLQIAVVPGGAVLTGWERIHGRYLQLKGDVSGGETAERTIRMVVAEE